MATFVDEVLCSCFPSNILFPIKVAIDLMMIGPFLVRLKPRSNF